MKYIKATFYKPCSALVQVDLPDDEFIKAKFITRAQQSLVTEMRKALEKQMVELTVNDLTFELQDEV